MIVVYVVDYILVFFLEFFKTMKYWFYKNSKKGGYMELGFQTDISVIEASIKIQKV
jgi:uncharacterized membrane protein